MKLNITPVNSDSESSDTNMYDASTDIDSPTSSSSTYILNISLDDSELDEMDPTMNHENVPSPITTIDLSTDSSDPSDSSEMSDVTANNIRRKGLRGS